MLRGSQEPSTWHRRCHTVSTDVTVVAGVAEWSNAHAWNCPFLSFEKKEKCKLPKRKKSGGSCISQRVPSQEREFESRPPRLALFLAGICRVGFRNFVTSSAFPHWFWKVPFWGFNFFEQRRSRSGAGVFFFCCSLFHGLDPCRILNQCTIS